MSKPKYPKGEPKCNSNQRLPGNWDANGVSSGKQTGAVRTAPDAYQGSRPKSEPRG
jgi:hypothetical protein